MMIKQVICPEWGKICITPYKRSAVRGKRSPQTINPGGVVHSMIGSTPPGTCSVCVTFLPGLRFAPTSRDKLHPGLCT